MLSHLSLDTLGPVTFQKNTFLILGQLVMS